MSANLQLIMCSCAVHRGPAGFCNLIVSKVDGDIELDPHVDGCCLLTLNEDAATELRDVLTEWLGG